MAEVLHLAHLVQHHRVAEMDVRRGGIEAELDAQRLAAGELVRDLGLDDELVGAALEDGELVRRRRRPDLRSVAADMESV